MDAEEEAEAVEDEARIIAAARRRASMLVVVVVGVVCCCLHCNSPHFLTMLSSFLDTGDLKIKKICFCFFLYKTHVS